MKKILFLFILLAAGVAVNAQIQKGSLLLGGRVSYSSSKTLVASLTPPERSNKSADINISAGKAWKENSVFGVTISYSPASTDDLYSTGTGVTISHRKTSQYGAGLFYRRYKKIAGDFYFFAEGNAGYIGSHQTEILLSGIKSKTTQSGGQLYLTPGISYNILKKLQAEIMIPSLLTVRYTHSSAYQNQFYIGTGLYNTSLGYLGVGFHWIL